MSFVVGQRWISHSEAQLGLGVIVEIAGRRVTIRFPAVDEDRIYAAANAPLSRIIYQSGEHIETHDQEPLRIESRHEQQGICFYDCVATDGSRRRISELELSCFVHLTTPRQRLLSAQLDKHADYQLRIETLHHRDRWQRADVRGLLGCRTSLLPHQVYIAAEVARRQAPRVLLADEVGLGKTIEAGMILHQQLQTGRGSRALIVVPPTLVHQWLVEMLRRFNLHFAIFDRERLDALRQGEDQNPFETEQLVLCSLAFLSEDEAALALACQAGWDLLIADEAHHLHWSEQGTDPGYRCIEALAAHSAGLLLLTATPEQAGATSHFARLRLLDPSRFHDLDAFRQEEAGYQQLNALVQGLLAQAGEPSADLIAALRTLAAEPDVTDHDEADRDQLIARLLDRHGTGRVMFRNTRAAIPCFPPRQLQAYPLPLPALYAPDGRARGIDGLHPELSVPAAQWLADDPRVAWLQRTLKALSPRKVLVICARAETATALEYHLQMRVGIRSTAFHEGLSIVERDRAAAWFADEEAGAQALICSEIGSEGRNFQFAHHLVLFDLPLNPDLIEQRIGRLDRIGQTHAIEIHVPYLRDSAMEVLFHWYQDGLKLFTQSFSAGYSVYEHFREPLLAQLDAPDEQLAALIEQTRSFTLATRQALQQGRDPLLELNSCNTAKAASLIAAIEDAETPATLEAYMERVFDLFGVDHEPHSAHTLVLRPTDHMLIEHFPGLQEAGTTVTFSRDRALVREDLPFISWEHPMVTEIMDLLLGSEYGNATVASLAIKGVPAGTLLLEVYYTVGCMAPASLQLERYLPLSPIRILMDGKGRDLGAALSHDQLNELGSGIARPTAQAIVRQLRAELENMLASAEQLATRQLPQLRDSASTAMRAALQAEIDRLEALRRVNPSIREEEILLFQRQIDAGLAHIERASLLLQGVRVVVTT